MNAVRRPHAKSDNTRRAYRCGVGTWCVARLDRPARSLGRRNRLRRRRTQPAGRRKTAGGQHAAAAGRRVAYLHYLAGCPSPHDHGRGHRDLCRTRPAVQAGRPGSKAEALPRRSASCARSWRPRAARPGCCSASQTRFAAPWWSGSRSAISRPPSIGCASASPSRRATGRARVAGRHPLRYARCSAGLTPPASPRDSCSAGSGPHPG